MTTVLPPSRNLPPAHSRNTSKQLPAAPQVNTVRYAPEPQIPPESSPSRPFTKIRSSLENTLRTAARSRPKPASTAAANDDVENDGKQRTARDDKEKNKMLRKIGSRVGLSRSGRESVEPPPLDSQPQSIIQRPKDKTSKTNIKIQETPRPRRISTHFAGFIRPSLRQASSSSPALHLQEDSDISTKSKISTPTPLTPKPSHPPRLTSPSAVALSSPKADGRKTPDPSTSSTPQRISSPTRPPHSQLRSPSHPRGLASSSTTNLPSTSGLVGSPPRPFVRRPSIDSRRPSIDTPRTSLDALKRTPSEIAKKPALEPRRPSVEARRTPLEARRPSLDASRRPSVDSPRRPSIEFAPGTAGDRPQSPDARRPSFDASRRLSNDQPTPQTPRTRKTSFESPRRISIEQQQRPVTPSATRAITPSSPHRPRAASPPSSPLYGYNRGFNASAASLVPTATPEQRDILHQATAVLSKELIRAPQGVTKAEWEEVVIRLQPLARLAKVWDRSPTGNSTSSSGFVSTGEERERRVFADALRDGLVLCYFANKLQPGAVSRIDPREDGFKRTVNITRFLAACSHHGVPFGKIFERDDIIEASPESLARVSETILAVSEAFILPPSARSKILTGQQSSLNAYGKSKAAISTPNLSTSPVAISPPATPIRRRWSPPSPRISEVNSSDMDSDLSNSTGLKPSVILSPSLLTQTKPSMTQISFPSTSDAGDSVVRSSVVSSTAMSESTSAYSSLLDYRQRRGSGSKFATIRTITTEATTAPSEEPSFTRSEGFKAAEELSRPVKRERRPSEPLSPDLTRVAEEEEHNFHRSNGADGGSQETTEETAAERIHLGKGIWPDDFIDAFKSKGKAIPIRPKTPVDTTEGNGKSLSVSPPRKITRPTHRARHSADPAGLLPKDTLARRDTSPSPSSPSPLKLKRSTSLVPSSSRNTGPLRSNPEDTRHGREDSNNVPFPMTENGGSSDSATPPGSYFGERSQHRGRYISSAETSNTRKARPISYDDLGRQRRSRFESMVNLGTSSTPTESTPRDSFEGSAIRETITVQEEGRPPTAFQLGNCIGRGQFGAVYRALNLNTGQMVAVKRIRLNGLKEDEVTQLMKEVDLVKSLSHPSIVKYEGMCRDKDTLNIILEYAENGSLGSTIKMFGKLNESLIAAYVVKILEGLHYLHQSDVVHCDLKAANILTTKTGNVKLSDFGVSLNLRAMEREIKDVAGTPNWMAPEVIELKGASTKADIWSLACTVIELVTGRPPYAEIANGMSVMFRIVEDERPPLPEGCSPLLEDFLVQCFNKDPKLRPSAEELFAHPWLQKVYDDLKDLRPQDSIPFIRRVSTDLQKVEGAHVLARLAEVDPSSPDIRQRHISLSSPMRSEDAMSSRDHEFVKTTFSKPMMCRVCHTSVKKNAVICQSCNLICHSKCSDTAPPTCDLRAQLLLYAQYAEKGNPNGAYAMNVDPIKQDPLIASPISEIAFGNAVSSSNSQLAQDDFIVHSPVGSKSPPTAYKFIDAFRRGKVPYGETPSSSTSLDTEAGAEELPRDTRDTRVITKKPSVLKKMTRPRPISVTSASTERKSASMRSGFDSETRDSQRDSSFRSRHSVDFETASPSSQSTRRERRYDDLADDEPPVANGRRTHSRKTDSSCSVQ